MPSHYAYSAFQIRASVRARLCLLPLLLRR